MSIYLKIPTVSGNVTTKGYEGWIELDDAEFAGIINNISMKAGEVSNRLNSYPRFGQVTIIKSLDKTSIALFEASHSAKVFPELQIDYVTNDSNPVAFHKLLLKNAAITFFADKHTIHTHEKPKEVICLAYTQMQRTHIPRDSLQKSRSPMTSGYDLETATKV